MGDKDIPTKKIEARVVYEIHFDDFINEQTEGDLLAKAVLNRFSVYDPEVEILSVDDSTYRYDPQVED